MHKGMKSVFFILALVSALAAAPLRAAVSAESSKQDSVQSTTLEHEAPVDINQASAEELAEALNGVGLKKAQSIIRYRQEFGPFKNIEQLLDVPGIGPSFIERNRIRLKW